MGNIGRFESITALCDLDFLSTHDLHRTSLNLNRSPGKKSLNGLHETTANSKSANSSNGKDRPDHPDPEKSPMNRKAHEEQHHLLTKNDFHMLEFLGTETLGKIYLVKKNDNGKLFLMKVFDKRRIQRPECMEAAEKEREIIKKAHHYSIPRLYEAFEDDRKIFYIMEYVQGEKLDERLHELTRFSDEITKFYAAEILTTLSYLHREFQVIYNNLNTENVVLDSEGHICFKDFGKVKSINPESVEEEVLLERKMNEFWQFGCLIYKLLTGHQPTYRRNGAAMRRRESLQWPSSVPGLTRDFVMRLLCPKIEERLGYNGIEEIKNHAFFNGICWQKIQQRLVYPPISPIHLKPISTEEQESETLQDEDERNNLFKEGGLCDLENIVGTNRLCFSDVIGRP